MTKEETNQLFINKRDLELSLKTKRSEKHMFEQRMKRNRYVNRCKDNF